MSLPTFFCKTLPIHKISLQFSAKMNTRGSKITYFIYFHTKYDYRCGLSINKDFILKSRSYGFFENKLAVRNIAIIQCKQSAKLLIKKVHDK